MSDLKKKYDDLLDRYCKLKAQQINNSPLRGYDGLADELEAERTKSKKLALAVDHFVAMNLNNEKHIAWLNDLKDALKEYGVTE